MTITLRSGLGRSLTHEEMDANFTALEPWGENRLFEHFGAVGNGVADDTAAVQAAIDYMILHGVDVMGFGTYRIAGRLTIDITSEHVYWDASTNTRPGRFACFGTLLAVHNDIALRCVGGILTNVVYVRNLIGPGVGAVGAVGGAEERIGIAIEKDNNNVVVDSITDFNYGFVYNGSWSSTVHIKSAIACINAVRSRLNPDTEYANQSHNLKIDYCGGIFSSEAFPDKAARRARGCDIGVYLTHMHGSTLDLGTVQYCQREATSQCIYADETVTDNRVFAYIEGGEGENDTQTHVTWEGHDNDLWLYHARSPDKMRTSVSVTGLGNRLNSMGPRIGETSLAAIYPDASDGAISIAQGNSVSGRYQIEDAIGASGIQYSVFNAATFTGSGSLNVTTGVTFPILEASGKTGVTLDWTGTDGHTWTSQAITISGETNNRVLKWIQYTQPVAGDVKVALYILKSADDSVIGTGMNVALTETGSIKRAVYMEYIDPAITGIKLRIVVRNNLDGDGEVTLSWPFATFNIRGDVGYSPSTAPTASIMQGVYAPTQRIFNEANKFNTASTTNLSGNACVTGGFPMVVITDNSGANNIQSFSNLKDRSPCVIVNGYSSLITVKDAAGAWGADFDIPVGEAITVVSIDSAVYRIN